MRTMFKGLYDGKTVLITGHTGFKGAWLSAWLVTLGAKVVGYALAPPTVPSLFEQARIDRYLRHEVGDVRDKEHLRRVMEEYKPHIVFHLAAQSLVRLSYEEPVLTYETNVLGTINLLEAVRCTNSVRACIIVTSDKCYENREWVYHYREIDGLGGYDPYSSSKACAELAVASYRSSFFQGNCGQTGTAVSTVRAGNVIGGGDWALDRIVPDVIRALANGEPVPVRNPAAIRPWQHVLEPLAGYLWLAVRMCHERDKYSSSWNFGPNNEGNLTVRELVERIIGYWGSGTWNDLSCNSPSQPHEAKTLRLDCTKANTLLSWKPVYNIHEAVQSTVEWYKYYYCGERTDVFQITLGQIEEYVAQARADGLAWA